jgi:hypothetical protein
MLLCTQPDWWALATAAADGNGAEPSVAAVPSTAAELAAAANGDAPRKAQSLASVGLEGGWTAPLVEGPRRPHPRYEHAVTVIGTRLFVVGGNAGVVPFEGVAGQKDRRTERQRQTDIKKRQTDRKADGQIDSKSQGRAVDGRG